MSPKKSKANATSPELENPFLKKAADNDNVQAEANLPGTRVESVPGKDDEFTFADLHSKSKLEPDESSDAFDVIWRLTGLSREHYMLDGPLGFKAWEMGIKNAEGRLEKQPMYSYSGKFRRISKLDEEQRAAIKRIAKRAATRRRPANNHRTLGIGLGEPCTYTIPFSDWQFGKNVTREDDPGKTGVEQTSLRIERAVEKSKIRIKDLRRRGVNLEGIAIGHMGDPIENVADSYESQTFNIEKNLKDQFMIALEQMAWTAEELLPLAEKQTIFGVLCNHGQLARRGTKSNITDNSDNAQNLLLEVLRDHILSPTNTKRPAPFPDIDWHLPGSEMITTLSLSGVPIAAAHGHKIPGDERAAARFFDAQNGTLLVQKRSPVMPRLWLLAHRHSLKINDYGTYWSIQMPTADGGSPSFTDISGRFSTPGTAAFLVGSHFATGFDELQLL